MQVLWFKVLNPSYFQNMVVKGFHEKHNKLLLVRWESYIIRPNPKILLKFIPKVFDFPFYTVFGWVGSQDVSFTKRSLWNIYIAEHFGCWLYKSPNALNMEDCIPVMKLLQFALTFRLFSKVMLVADYLNNSFI